MQRVTSQPLLLLLLIVLTCCCQQGRYADVSSTDSTECIELRMHDADGSNAGNVRGSVSVSGHVSEEQLHELQNCTTVEGNVELVLLHYQHQVPLLPRLIQITGRLTVYRVSGVSNLGGDLVPRLKVVNGWSGGSGHNTPHQLPTIRIQGNPHLREIGLPGLYVGPSPSPNISRVYIRENRQLCVPYAEPWLTDAHVQRMDFNCEANGCHFDDPNCTEEDNSSTHCSNCTSGCVTSHHHSSRSGNVVVGGGEMTWQPGPGVVPSGGGGITWQPDPGGVPSGEQCCHTACAGGCSTGNDSTSCTACRHYEQDGACVDSCAHNCLKYRGYRCVHPEQCLEGGGTVSMKRRLNSVAGQQGGVCGSLTLEGLETELPDGYSNCSIVQGSITIRGAITGVMLSLLSELFMDQLVVTEYIHVTETSLMSLGFLFNKLARVEGEVLLNSYAVDISDNIKLQELKSEGVRDSTALVIGHGGTNFRGNSKLCPTEIGKTILEDFALLGEADLTLFSRRMNRQNGVNVPCNLSPIAVTTIQSSPRSLTVTWEGEYRGPYKALLQSYIIYYRAARPNQTVRMFDGRDACSDEVIWQRVQTMDSSTNSTTLENLTPGTIYVLYVEGDVLPSYGKGIYDSMHGARSRLVECATTAVAPTKPLSVRTHNTPHTPTTGSSASVTSVDVSRTRYIGVHAEDLDTQNNDSGNTVVVTWGPPLHPGGIIAGYQVMVCPTAGGSGHGRLGSTTQQRQFDDTSPQQQSNCDVTKPTTSTPTSAADDFGPHRYDNEKEKDATLDPGGVSAVAAVPGGEDASENTVSAGSPSAGAPSDASILVSSGSVLGREASACAVSGCSASSVSRKGTSPTPGSSSVSPGLSSSSLAAPSVSFSPTTTLSPSGVERKPSVDSVSRCTSASRNSAHYDRWLRRGTEQVLQVFMQDITNDLYLLVHNSTAEKKRKQEEKKRNEAEKKRNEEEKKRRQGRNNVGTKPPPPQQEATPTRKEEPITHYFTHHKPHYTSLLDLGKGCVVNYVPHVENQTGFSQRFHGLEYYARLEVSVRACHGNHSDATAGHLALCSPWRTEPYTTHSHPDRDKVTKLEVLEASGRPELSSNKDIIRFNVSTPPNHQAIEGDSTGLEHKPKSTSDSSRANDATYFTGHAATEELGATSNPSSDDNVEQQDGTVDKKSKALSDTMTRNRESKSEPKGTTVTGNVDGKTEPKGTTITENMDSKTESKRTTVKGNMDTLPESTLNNSTEGNAGVVGAKATSGFENTDPDSNVGRMKAKVTSDFESTDPDSNAGAIKTKPSKPEKKDNVSDILVTWEPPKRPSGGVILKYIVDLPNMGKRFCVDGRQFERSNNSLLLLGVPYGRQNDITVTVFSLAGNGTPVTVWPRPWVGPPVWQATLVWLLVLCGLCLFIIAGLTLLLTKKQQQQQQLLPFDDMYKLSNPSYAPVGLADEFIIDAAAVLPLPNRVVGYGNFSIVLVGYLLRNKSEDEKPRNIGGGSMPKSDRLLKNDSMEMSTCDDPPGTNDQDHNCRVSKYHDLSRNESVVKLAKSSCSYEEEEDEEEEDPPRKSTNSKLTKSYGSGSSYKLAKRNYSTRNYYNCNSEGNSLIIEKSLPVLKCCTEHNKILQCNKPTTNSNCEAGITAVAAEDDTDMFDNVTAMNGSYDSSASTTTRGEVDDGVVEGSGESLVESASDREVAIEELKKRKDWMKWRIYKKVAVKVVTYAEDETPDEKDVKKLKFIREAMIMQSLTESPFVLRLVGAVMQEPLCLLTELVDQCNLRDFVRNTSNPLDETRVYELIIQVADGMAYIASKRIVHNDLACRNCLLKGGRIVKIADFGLSRKLHENKYYCRYQTNVPLRKRLGIFLPKFLAPESRQPAGHDVPFYLKSDVWSYGLLVWEVMTRAAPSTPVKDKEPPKLPPEDRRASVCRWLSAGQVLPPHQRMAGMFPHRLHPLEKLLNECWQDRPEARPSFHDIVETLLDRITHNFDREFRHMSFHVSQKNRDSESAEDEGVHSMPESSRETIDEEDSPVREDHCCVRLLSIGHESSMGASLGRNLSGLQDRRLSSAIRRPPSGSMQSNDEDSREEAAAFLSTEGFSRDAASANHASDARTCTTSKSDSASTCVTSRKCNRISELNEESGEVNTLAPNRSDQRNLKGNLNLQLNLKSFSSCDQKPYQLVPTSSSKGNHCLNSEGYTGNRKTIISSPVVLPSTQKPRRPSSFGRPVSCSYLASQEYLDMSPKKTNCYFGLPKNIHDDAGPSCLLDADSNSDNLEVTVRESDMSLEINDNCDVRGYTRMNGSCQERNYMNNNNEEEISLISKNKYFNKREFEEKHNDGGTSQNRNQVKINCQAMIHASCDYNHIQEIQRKGTTKSNDHENYSYTNVCSNSGRNKLRDSPLEKGASASSSSEACPLFCFNEQSQRSTGFDTAMSPSADAPMSSSVDAPMSSSVDGPISTSVDAPMMSYVDSCESSNVNDPMLSSVDGPMSSSSLAAAASFMSSIVDGSIPSAAATTLTSLSSNSSLVNSASIDTLFPSVSTCTSAVTSPCEDFALLPLAKLDNDIESSSPPQTGNLEVATTSTPLLNKIRIHKEKVENLQEKVENLQEKAGNIQEKTGNHQEKVEIRQGELPYSNSQRNVFSFPHSASIQDL